MRTFLFVLCVIQFFPRVTLAQTTTPCMVFENGQWQPINKKLKRKKDIKGEPDTCVQYTKEAYKPVVDRLVQLDHLKKNTLPLLRSKARKLETLDQNWKLSQSNWKQQTTAYNDLIKYNQQEAKTWREAFLELQKQKAPKDSWTKSPVLWFTIGIVSATALTVVVVMAINAGK